MDYDSAHKLQSKSSVPLHGIVPEILAHLEHLDLTSRLFVKEERAISMGAYSDISKGAIKSDDGDRTVAVKRLRVAGRADIKILFEKEIYVWKELKHPNILPLLGFAFDSQGYPLLLSPWMSNGSALDFVAAHRECDLMHLIIGIAQGIEYLHDLNVVHSDIKPDNILISDSKDALISDFGCSRIVSESQSFTTLSSGVTGPPQYKAYELLTGSELKHTKESDVWAFGMTMYELLIGQRAYANSRTYAVVILISQMQLPPEPSTTHPSISPEMSKILWKICQCCWKANPMERADMKVILKMLSPKEIVRDTGDDQETDSTNPRSIAPEILDNLKHLDLSDRLLFEERRIIHGGAYADIFKGHYRTSEKVIQVAVKMVRFHPKEEMKMHFEQEIYVWAKLKHPNILPLLGYAFDTQTGYPLLVSEWIENGSAWNFVITHPNCDLMRIVAGMARGLAYLHKKGVVHSDVKSDNVLVSNAGDALICGFGLSRMISTSGTFTNFTTSGVKGSARYLAYELVTNSASDHSAKSDVWAFGMTVLELLAQERPYAANINEAMALSAIGNRELPVLPPNSGTFILSEDKQKLWEICQLCWVFDPDKRVDMDSILKMLGAADDL